MLTLSGKRILFLFGSLDMGGAERQGLLLARHLKEYKGADVKVWGLGKKSGSVSCWCDACQIPWRALPLHWGLRRRLPHLLRFMFYLRREKPEILLSFTKVPNLASALFWKLCGVKLMVWNQADAGLLLEPVFFHRYAVNKVRHFIANSEGGQRFLIEKFGIEAGKVTLIRNGIAVEPPRADRAGWRRELKVDTAVLIVVMVANLSSYKDHATLLDSWKLLLQQWKGVPPVLVLAGRFDDRADALQKQVLKLGITENVRFLGVVDDISGLLSASDLCVYSSPSEGIPNAVVEAMASGLAITGTDIPGMREAVGDEGKVFLVPPADSSALAEIMIQLLSDTDSRLSMGRLMKARASELFSFERFFNDTVRYLESFEREYI